MTGFPADPDKLEVGIAYGGSLSADPATLAYTPITSKVLPRAIITRGRIDDSRVTQPTTVDLTLRDPTGEFSPRNIAGPHYGNLRRNTPIRVRVDPGTGFVTRASANVPDWNPSWTGPNMGDRIRVQASGAMTRISQNRSVKSSARRSIPSSTGLVAYWPFEDPAGSNGVTSPTRGVSKTFLPVPKRVTFGEPGPAGSLGAALLVTAEPVVGPFSDNRPALILTIPSHTAGEFVLSTWFQGAPFLETAGAPTDADLVVAESWLNFATGGVGSFVLRFTETVPGASALLSYVTFDAYTGPDTTGSDFGEIDTSTSGIQIFDGAWHNVTVKMAQSGADIAVSLWLDGTQWATQTITGTTLGLPFQYKLGTSGGVSGATETTPNTQFRVSQVSAHNDAAVSAADLYDYGAGYPGEQAGTRFARLCAEENIPASVVGGTSEPMGPQLPGTTFDLLRECEAADEATMLDRREGKLGFDGVNSRYDQDVFLTVDYAIVADVAVDDGDGDLVNDVTVTRVGGVSAQYRQLTGPLSVNPNTGAGQYPRDYTRSLNTDEQASHHASWLVSLGTVDEPRYVLRLDLRANPGLVSAWLGCDIGSRIIVTNPPAQHTGPAPLDLIIEGYTETLDAVEWSVVLYCLPYRPYEVHQIGNTTGNRSRIAAEDGGSTTNATYGPTVTALSVTSATVRWIDSATYGAQFPIVIEIAGEPMTCTAITGTGLTQTFTVTRGLYGVAKTLPSGSAVQIWRPPCVAL